MKALKFCMITGLLVIILPMAAMAQVTDCRQFPAPCPHSGEINQAMDFSTREQGNAVTAQEMAMETNLRNLLTNMLQKVARPNHWQVYELTESDYDRPNTLINYARWCATPYEKRPPHLYEISFILIVNKDSLQAWKDWYSNVLPQQANQQVENIKVEGQSEANDQVLKALNDSVQYYTMLSGNYMQAHAEEYASDIKNNNQKGIKRYSDKVNEYSKRSDVFVKKIQEHVNGSRASSGNSYNQFAASKANQTEHFINASVVLIHFLFNPEHFQIGMKDNNDNQLSPQKGFTATGAYYAGLFHKPSPPDGQAYLINEHDYEYYRPSNIATLLFGKWQTKSNNEEAYGGYLASKAADDLISPKAVKCDMIQNMAVNIEGRPDYIKQVLNGLGDSALQKLVLAKLNE